MARVKLYGSTSFTPTDLPAGVTLERGDISAFFAGCLGERPPPLLYTDPGCTDEFGDGTIGEGYDYLRWRTRTEWSFGGYFANCFPQGPCRDPHILTWMQDENTNTGIDFFTNDTNDNKRLMGRVGLDVPDNGNVSYVRIWVSGSCPNGNTAYVRPHWQIVGGGNINPGGEEDKGWLVDGPDPQGFQFGPATAAVPQKSVKLLSMGQPMTGELIKATGFGTRFGFQGLDPYTGRTGPGYVYFWINELGIEVGFDLAANFTVTTDSASPTSTTADLFGTANPNGDTSASNVNFFQYGLSLALGTPTPDVAQPMATSHPITANITGLTANRLYYYRAVCKNSAGNLIYGEIKTFFTSTSCSTRLSLVS